MLLVDTSLVRLEVRRKLLMTFTTVSSLHLYPEAILGLELAGQEV